MPKNENDIKWICSSCTYGNWPNAVRCVMCNRVKLRLLDRPICSATQEVCEEIICPSSERQIISTSDRRANNNLICPSERLDHIISTSDYRNSSNNNNLKWTCASCSYFNWMKAEICVMCRSAKPEEFCKIETLRNIENAGAGECKSGANIKEQKPLLSNKSKWTCMKCTYENWPKTLKCIICQHPKNKQYRQEEKQDKRDRAKRTSPRRSPPRSPLSLSRQSSNNIYDSMPTNDENCKITDLVESMSIMSCSNNSNNEVNARLKQICNRMTTKDILWLAACKGVVEKDTKAVSSYLAASGDLKRQLTSDDALVLNDCAKYEPGHTLVHLALRFHREEILRMLLRSEPSRGSSKKLPCHVCPELSMTIRKQIAHSIRTRKDKFSCPFFTELVTFSLPGEIIAFTPPVQHQLFKEILDTDVRKVLEEESLINWSSELTNQYGSRLCPLWNRAAGDCLLDSVLQATWGVFDRDNSLRKKLYEALSEGQNKFFPRWQEAEEIQASEMNYALEQQQWHDDWHNIVATAACAGNSLEQMHVFALAHILRRPIIIYGVKYVKSMRGESIDLARFEGVYLPLLWDVDFCWKNPIALAYTRGHFSALVPLERPSYGGAGAGVDWNEDDSHVTYLPLIDHEGHLLPVHFLTVEEIGMEEQLLQKRLDVCLTDAGILTAKQVITPRPASVSQMIDEWMNRYRKLQIEISEAKGAAE